MKILSMTATFGKLEHETLVLQPGLNILEAPNEWGKSTWCAFLVAMLYGIDTRQQTTKTALADKERYAPWSGVPMSGRMDILWNGRAVTLERTSKPRAPFGVFRAYETESGLAVPELTGANCGEMLLGMEKEVFLRAAFLRLADLPLASSEAWSPCSTMRPSRITRITSASRMVLKRCATMKVVRPCIMAAKAF